MDTTETTDTPTGAPVAPLYVTPLDGETDVKATTPAPVQKPMTRDEFFGVAESLPRQWKDIILPEPMEGRVVRIIGLSAGERDQWEKSLMKGKGSRARMEMDDVRAKLVIRVAVNPDFTPMFGQTDIKRVSKLPAKIVATIFNAAQEMSSVSDEDIDELAGNSDDEESDD